MFVFYLFVFVTVDLITGQEVISSEGNGQPHASTLILSAEEERSLKVVNQGFQQFTIDFYLGLTKGESGNIFISPISVDMVLSLLIFGTGRTTTSELDELLSLPERVDDMLIGFRSLLRVMQGAGLYFVNRIFIEASFQVKEDFQEVAESYFLSKAVPLDFMKAPEEAKEYINSFIKSQTNNTIKTFLPPGVINSDTRLALTNAIYFKKNWRTMFDTGKTHEHDFYVSKNKTVRVKMMNIKSKFSYYYDTEMKAKYLSMDFEGGYLTMLLVLPDAVDELRKLTVDIFDKLKRMELYEVTVAIPKFKLKKDVQLNKVLQDMGARAMFSDSADFSGLSEESMKVDIVLQSTVIDVTESGTEAAAATAAAIIPRSIPAAMLLPSYSFIADHPFLFLILVKNYEIPLFCGRYMLPE